ncbi:helix-turn-helix domain-containing protein [Laceyella putida]|uniref:Helix-turn-helix domain-containing protein n=1 Tax=Laceyella putida TaxID=110101 RepID=A0ABW2RP87_9BACL
MSVSAQEKFGSYGFRFQEETQSHIANIWNIGWEEQTSPRYDWDGLKRGETGKYVFQYTLSGYGVIEVDGQTIRLDKNKAFLVPIPSAHRYYLPRQSKRWELIFITLYGREVERIWHAVREQVGPVIQVVPESPLIRLLFRLYQETREQKITDAFYASAKAYEFAMECYRFAKNLTGEKGPSTSVSKAMHYIESHYADPLTLEEIALAAGVSRFYLIKQFRDQQRTTPMRFVTRLRIKKAVELLRHTTLTVKEIANRVGYEDANYFNKVFRRTIGISAGQFRESKQMLPIDHVVIE